MADRLGIRRDGPIGLAVLLGGSRDPGRCARNRLFAALLGRPRDGRHRVQAALALQRPVLPAIIGQQFFDQAGKRTLVLLRSLLGRGFQAGLEPQVQQRSLQFFGHVLQIALHECVCSCIYNICTSRKEG